MSLIRGLARRFSNNAPFDKSQLEKHGIFTRKVSRNLVPAKYYEKSITGLPSNPGTAPSCVTNTGAYAAYSGDKTGRSPADKVIVDPLTKEEDNKIWWGKVNKKMPRDQYERVVERAVDYLNNRDELFIVDGFAGWDPKYRKTVRIICTRPYHALFMNNMLIRPSDEELRTAFSNPDFVVYNAGEFYAHIGTTRPGSKTCVALDPSKGTACILGTQYAGEMKKGLFTMMHYWMPDQGVLSLHSSANEGIKNKDVTLLFGLSGTGKTTLSADPKRQLIGDDEHCWT